MFVILNGADNRIINSICNENCWSLFAKSIQSTAALAWDSIRTIERVGNYWEINFIELPLQQRDIKFLLHFRFLFFSSSPFYNNGNTILAGCIIGPPVLLLFPPQRQRDATRLDGSE